MTLSNMGRDLQRATFQGSQLGGAFNPILQQDMEIACKQNQE